jgi:DNA-binding NtrC family response regulator
MAVVLVVEDQPAVRTALEILFDVHGFPVVAVATPAEAIQRARAGDVAVVVQDMNFTRETTSGEEGIALFRELRGEQPQLPVVLLTAWASLATAITLVKEGAADYVQKPWDDAQLVAVVRELFARFTGPKPESCLPAESPRRELARTFDLCGLVYESAAMHELITLALHVAKSNAPVLITGPNGSGKEKIAEIIQRNSRRAGKPFVKVNAGALPETLMESELFGAEPGAFTGATKLRVGRFEAADGGTLFLDEIANLSLPGQMKLLRVLQSGEYERLGSPLTRRCDVRIISATNADLPSSIADKTFREDLYFRLNLIELCVPSLSSRRDDILPLAEHFLLTTAQAAGESARRLSPAARAALVAYAWPGNVRELGNRMQRALIVARGATIEATDVGLPDGSASSRPRPAPATAPPAAPAGMLDRAGVEALLASVDGNVTRAAAALGQSRQAFYRRVERLGIVIDRKKAD